MRRPLRLLLPVLACLLAACSSGPPKTRLRGIEVAAALGANANTATALDVVFVFDPAALPLLPKTGPEWFEHKAALAGGLANAIEVVSVQVPPAAALTLPLPARHARAIGVYSFANYVAPAGQPVANLTPFRQVTLRLAPERIDYDSRD